MKYLIFPLLIFLISCSTSTTEVIIQEPEVQQPKVQEQREVLTSCTTLYDLDAATRSSTEDAFTLYRDQMMFKNYEEAEKLWKVAYNKAPGSNGKATYHFDDGIKIHHHFFQNETDEDKRAELVSTILSIYDKRMECFDDDGTIQARKAFNSYYSYRNHVNDDDIFEAFKDVVYKKGNEADYFIVNPFSRMVYDRLLDSTLSHDQGRDIVYRILDIVDFGKANCKDQYCEAWEIIEEYSPELLSGLEGYRGFFDCQYYMDKYYNQFLEDPTNCENVNEVYLKMVWAKCDEADERFVTLREAKEKECYVPPPPPGPLKQAYTFLEGGQFTEAIQKFEEYVLNTEDPEKKADKLLIISKIYYAHIKNFPAARKYALQAADYRRNWGDPFMLIGKLYASSGPLCGPGRGWDSQVVTWPAIDKFIYAKTIDPAVAPEANKWIARYRQYMPSREDIFLRQIEKGSSFLVPCWIQERTLVRTSD